MHKLRNWKLYPTLMVFIWSFIVYRAQLFDLAVSLLPGLDSKEIDLLFVAIQPALKVHPYSSLLLLTVFM